MNYTEIKKQIDKINAPGVSYNIDVEVRAINE